MDNFTPAQRLKGFDQPRVWTIMTPLAQKHQAANLGQGFPTWSPPEFYTKFFHESLQQSHHQYTRSYGSLPFVKAIANFHQNIYPEDFPKINPETDIVISNGGSEGLFSIFMGLLNKGDQVILFDPSYDCYRSQIQMSGGVTVGIPLKPRHQQSKQQIQQRLQNQPTIQFSEKDHWQIDFEEFQSKLNEKTKIVLITSPHNPIGKIFSEEELQKIANILQKYPNIVVVEDNVYEGMTFDSRLGKRLPKINFLSKYNMYQRTLSVYSAGKIFAATGVRSGWVIGPANLIRAVRSVHQYNVFCYYDVLENTLTNCLNQISKPQNTYMVDYATKLRNLRNSLVEQLLKSKFDFDFWIPEGGNFIIADISKVKIDEKYMKDEQGNPRTKDYAFAIQLIFQEGVSVIPCSPFYGSQHQKQGEKYIRLTFCKDQDLIREAGRRMRSQ